MRRAGIAGLVGILALLLAACDQSQETVSDDKRPDPVVVYAAFEDEEFLQNLFARYTDESGVLVIVRRGAADKIVDDLIENKIIPPADVLMTRSVAGVWRAAEEGALRPLYSESIKQKVPAWLQDPDGLWFGTGYRTAVIVHGMAGLAGAGVADFAALAEPRFEDALCLSSSANAVNRTVVAMLIETMGERPAELAVRGWMKNLALPVFDTEAKVIDAVRSGDCGFGIVSSSASAMSMADDPRPGLSILTPETTYADVDGIAVARHARNPDGAAALLEWLFSTQVQSSLAAETLVYPADRSAAFPDALDRAAAENVSNRNAGLAAWHEEAAVKLAERARYSQ